MKLINRVCRLLGICSRIDSRLDIRTAASGDGCVHMLKCIYRRTARGARSVWLCVYSVLGQSTDRPPHSH